MSVSSIITAAQVINAGVAGVTSAPDLSALPLTLESIQLPAAIVIPGQATWQRAGMGGGWKCERQYMIRCLVTPDSTEPVIAFPRVATLIEAMGAVWRATKTVGGALVTNVEDQGSQRTYGYGGAQFYGCEFRITVKETN